MKTLVVRASDPPATAHVLSRCNMMVIKVRLAEVVYDVNFAAAISKSALLVHHGVDIEQGWEPVVPNNRYTKKTTERKRKSETENQA